MPAIEAQLISYIVSTGDLESVVRWGISAEDFLIQSHRSQFTMLQAHASAPKADGKPLGVNAFLESNRDFILCHDKNTTVDYLCERVRRNRVGVNAEEINADVARILQSGDVQKAIDLAGHRFTELQTLLVRKDTDVTFEESYDRLLALYKLSKQGINTSVCSWAWPPLNRVSKGIQKTDYIVWYGRPKTGKSWLLAWQIMHAYNEGLRVLVYTKEMSPDDIFHRLAAIFNHLDFHRLNMTELYEEEEHALYEGRALLEALRRGGGQSIIALNGAELPDGGDTVPWLRSKIAEHKPHLVAIDGLYLMSDVLRARKDHERVRNISRAVRRTVLAIGIPVIATLQANRAEPGEMRDIAFSDALAQDPTAVFRCLADKGSPTISVVVSGVRNFLMPGFRVWAKPATDFGFHSMLSAQDIEKAKEKDTGEMYTEEDVEHAKPRKRRGKAKESAISRIERSMAVVEEIEEVEEVDKDGCVS